MTERLLLLVLGDFSDCLRNNMRELNRSRVTRSERRCLNAPGLAKALVDNVDIGIILVKKSAWRSESEHSDNRIHLTQVDYVTAVIKERHRLSLKETFSEIDAQRTISILRKWVFHRPRCRYITSLMCKNP